MTRAFIIYVRPLLEYCSPVWSPHFKQDIDLIENVQRSFTRKLFDCCNLVSKSYDDRLTYLGLQRLELRRIYADLIHMFKLIYNNIFLSHTSMFSNLIIRFIVEKQEDRDINCFLIVVISWFSTIFLQFV